MNMYTYIYTYGRVDKAEAEQARLAAEAAEAVQAPADKKPGPAGRGPRELFRRLPGGPGAF